MPLLRMETEVPKYPQTGHIKDPIWVLSIMQNFKHQTKVTLKVKWS